MKTITPDIDLFYTMILEINKSVNLKFYRIVDFFHNWTHLIK